MQHDAPSDIPTVTAYGEADDHLRLTVLLAEALKSYDPDAAAECQRPERNAWSQRREALASLLQSAALRRSAHTPAVRVRDVAALPSDLATAGGDRWDDVTFARARAELRETLSHGIETQVVAVDTVDATGEAHDAVSGFDPTLRPLVRWLLKGQHVHAPLLQQYLAHRPEHVLTVALSALSWEAHRAALRLSALRGPQRLNGVFGPVTLHRSAVDHTSLSTMGRAAVDELLTAGLLLPDETQPGCVYFPRKVRDFLRLYAHEFSSAEVQQDHRELAQGIVHDTVAQTLERHYHAVLGNDLKLARESATYYGADLRAIAREASLRRDYEGAATLYEEIVTRFDPHDAYAWEYLGYNLWWPVRTRPAEAREDRVRRIEEALTRACTRDAYNRENPLYLGRLVGFQGWLGRPIEEEFRRRVHTFAARLSRQPDDDKTDLSWFATQVRTALEVAGRSAEYTRLCAGWSRPSRTSRILQGVASGEPA